MLPNLLVTRAYVVRGLWLWVGVRAVAAAVFATAELEPLPLSAGAVIQVILLCVIVGFVDIRRRHERALLGNLGLGNAAMTLLFVAPAIFGEIILRRIAHA